MELPLNKMKALLMKIETSYFSALEYVDLTKHNEYNIARKLIDMIEENNGKKLETKKKFTLMDGGKNAE